MDGQNELEKHLDSARRDLEGDFPVYKALESLTFDTYTEAEVCQQLFLKGVARIVTSKEQAGPYIVQVPMKDYENRLRKARREHAQEMQRQELAGQRYGSPSECGDGLSVGKTRASSLQGPSTAPSHASTAATQHGPKAPRRVDSMNADPESFVDTTLDSILTFTARPDSSDGL